MIVRKLLSILGCLLATISLPSIAAATPLALDNSWVKLNDFPQQGQNVFWFTGTGWGSPDQQNATRYTWTSASLVKFQLTDYFVVGDSFSVFDGAQLIGAYSGKSDYTAFAGCSDGFGSTCHWTFDPNIAWTDGAFNQGTLIFAPGSHAITIRADSTPSGFEDATVAFRADEMPVPEPASLVLIGSGLVGLAARARRRNRS